MLNGRRHHHRPHRPRSRLRYEQSGLYHRSPSSIHRHHLIHQPLPMMTPTWRPRYKPTMTRSTLTTAPTRKRPVRSRRPRTRYQNWARWAHYRRHPLRWLDQDRPPHPTNGDLVLVIIIRRRRRQQLPWRGGWLFWSGRPPRQTCHDHLL